MAKRRYSVAIPHSRGKILSSTVSSAVAEAPVINPALTNINDMFLHALFARIATAAGDTHEFGSTYDPYTNSIEIDIPDDILEFVESVEIKPKIQRFIAWLTQNSQFWHKYTDDRDQTSIKTGFPNVGVTSISFLEVHEVTSTEVDWAKGNKQKVLLTQNMAFSFQKPAGPTSLQLIITQDSVGGHTATFPSELKWPNGNVQSVTLAAESIDVLSILWDGEQYLATMVKNFS